MSLGDVSIGSSFDRKCEGYKRHDRQASSFFKTCVCSLRVWLFEDVFSVDVSVIVFRRIPV